MQSHPAYHAKKHVLKPWRQGVEDLRRPGVLLRSLC
jgi:hypothetical protein